MRNIAVVVTFLLVLSSCKSEVNPEVTAQSAVAQIDPLPSWNEGETKKAIMAYGMPISYQKWIA
jgi:hypothetical protein